jgi:hypothetical protein
MGAAVSFVLRKCDKKLSHEKAAINCRTPKLALTIPGNSDVLGTHFPDEPKI